MRRRNLLLAGAKYLFVGAIVASAFAATSPAVNADGMAPRAAAGLQTSANWSGFYVGTQSGFAWSSIDGSLAGAGPAGPGTFSVDHDTEFYGFTLGVQHQMGNVVLGLEGNWLNMFVNNPGATTCPSGVATRCTSRIDDILSVGGRLGWAMGHWMPYVSGGYASSSFTFRANNNVPVAVEDGRTRNDGWYVGAGFDMVVAPGWTTGLEYRHFDFGDTSSSTFSPAGVALETLTQSATVDTVSVRLTYKWDIPGRYAAPPMK
jgi:opacity protein-like surface antigen